MDRLAALMRVLAHPSRLRILLLLRSGPLSPAQIAASLPMTHDVVARQLRALRQAKLVSARPSGDGAQILDVPGVVLRILVAIENDPRGWS